MSKLNTNYPPKTKHMMNQLVSATFPNYHELNSVLANSNCNLFNTTRLISFSCVFSVSSIVYIYLQLTLWCRGNLVRPLKLFWYKLLCLCFPYSFLSPLFLFQTSTNQMFLCILPWSKNRWSNPYICASHFNLKIPQYTHSYYYTKCSQDLHSLQARFQI